MDWPDGVGLAASTFVLLACLYYGYVGVLLRPDLGFGADARTGIVTQVETPCGPGEPCIREGDRILTLAGVPFSRFTDDRLLVLYDPLTEVPSPIPVTLERGGREISLTVTPSTRHYGSPLVGMAAIVIPLAFWLAGSLGVLFLRPRDERWLALAAWCFLTALWFAAGFTSETHLGYSAVVFHLAIWMWNALTIHLHLVLPGRILKRIPLRLVLALVYLGASAGAVLDLGRRIPNTAFVLPTVATILLSLGILTARLFLDRSPTLRQADRIMAYGVALGALPVLLFGLLPLALPPVPWTPSIGVQTLIALLAILAIPLWPLSYLYALYRPRVRGLEFRGNRLLGTYGFLALMVFGYLTFLYAAASLSRALHDPGEADLERRLLLITVVSSVIVVALAAPLRSAFQHWVDRRIFGLQYSPQEVVEAMAAKLPGGFDALRLQAILREDLLPTLMIRESALYLFASDGIRTFLAIRVPEEPPEVEELRSLEAWSGRFLGPEEVPPIGRWVRLVVPLEAQDAILGYWLLGSRDPDDFYSRSDVDLLTKLANQVAVVLKSQWEMEERRRLQRHLLEAQKMEALGRLAAGVAHDFNNLLAVVLVAAEMAMEKAGDDSELHDLLGEITVACDRAARLTRQLLTFSRRQSFDARPVDLDQVVTDDLTILQSVTGGRVELRLALSGDLPLVHADPVQLEQILLNLAINAVDAMPERGTLEIATDVLTVEGPDEQVPGTPPAGRWVRLSVRDTGEGIAPHVIDRIFEPFFTTKADRGGTGLGLSLVYGIVHQSGGHTFVESQSRRGTTFDIYLPALQGSIGAAEPTPPDARAAATAPPPEPRPVRVLLAEDEDDIRNLVSRMLRSWGYEVVAARNGVEALALSDSTEGAIDLLVTDLVMPRMGGAELAARLRERRPEIRVLYISGYVPDDSLTREGDGVTLLAKPFTTVQLKESLQKVLRA